MRVTLGAVAVLGLAVTVATGQPGRERAAALKPPQPLAPNELPPVARGAADDFPPSMSVTPVPRPVSATPGPAWLTGDVAPAGGLSTKSNAVRALGAPPSTGKDEKVPPPPKMLDRLKVFPGDKSPAPAAPVPAAQAPQPTPQPPPPQPTASSPFRGTGSNGAPVFAGPPAYRWYGWGSVTPGANPLAPAGQYPKASANWYQITGATPGAFPVPVTGDARVVAGTEPPTYGLAARTPLPAPVVAAAAPPTFVDRPEPSKFPAPEMKPAPTPGAAALPPPFAPPAVPVPALSPPPIPRAAVAPTLPPPEVPPASATVAPPQPPAPKAEPAAATPAPPKADSVAVLPPPSMAIPAVAPSVAPALVPSVAPATPIAVAPSAEPTKPAPRLPVEPKAAAPTPAPLPTSVTADPPRDEAKWKQSAEPAAPRPGAWAPANGPAAPAPLPTVPVEPPAGWQTGRAGGAPIVARGQFGDGPADPIDTLVRQMCQGRATDVEVRHTGTKKLQVCFEARSGDDARKLVADISRRPELSAYQIDFCVLVK